MQAPTANLAGSGGWLAWQMLPCSPGEMLGEARKTSPLCKALGALEGLVLVIRVVPKIWPVAGPRETLDR